MQHLLFHIAWDGNTVLTTTYYFRLLGHLVARFLDLHMIETLHWRDNIRPRPLSWEMKWGLRLRPSFFFKRRVYNLAKQSPKSWMPLLYWGLINRGRQFAKWLSWNQLPCWSRCKHLHHCIDSFSSYVYLSYTTMLFVEFWCLDRFLSGDISSDPAVMCNGAQDQFTFRTN